MTVDTERRMCLICGRVLDRHEPPGGGPSTWQHSLGSPAEENDHPVIAVLVEEAPEQLRSRCDFCYADGAWWILPARTFAMPGMHNQSVGDWAACEPCARLLEHDQWNRLFDRVKASYEARQGPMKPVVETGLKAMYRRLRKNVTGAIRLDEEYR